MERILKSTKTDLEASLKKAKNHKLRNLIQTDLSILNKFKNCFPNDFWNKCRHFSFFILKLNCECLRAPKINFYWRNLIIRYWLWIPFFGMIRGVSNFSAKSLRERFIMWSHMQKTQILVHFRTSQNLVAMH